MGIPGFQYLIIITILLVAAVFYFKKIKYKNKRIKPIIPVSITASFWVIWTFSMVGTAALQQLQFTTIIATVGAIYLIYKLLSKKDKETEKLKSNINQLKQDLERLDNRRLQKSYKRFKENITPVIGAQAHRNLLLNSLNEAKETLVILSGWATEYAINLEFKNLVKNCLDRGVQIYIGYGYQTKKNGKKISSVKKLETESVFKELQEWCAEFEKKGRINVWYYPNHSKVLICDKKYIVCGSFNWLSNIGSSANEERSYKIEDTDFIDDELSEILNSLHSPMKATKRQVLKFFHKWSDY